jgi:hypothetical protein
LTVSILLVILIFSIGCSVIGESASPTPMVSDVQPDDIYDALNCYNCTSAQRTQLVNDFVGTRVRWTERVTDVNEDGSVHIRTSSIRFILFGIPRSETNILRVGEEITFEGILSSPSNKGYWWELQNTKIIK